MIKKTENLYENEITVEELEEIQQSLLRNETYLRHQLLKFLLM